MSYNELLEIATHCSLKLKKKNKNKVWCKKRYYFNVLNVKIKPLILGIL